MSDFWKRVIKADPKLIDSTVYFSPTKLSNLRCLLRDDGTVSPACKPNVRFGTISDLINGWKCGLVTDDNGKVLSSRTKTNKLTFADDFFFNSGRQNLVWNILRGAKDKTDSANDGQETTRPCPGFHGQMHAETMVNKKWNGERSNFSPVNIEGDRLRSKTCAGSIGERLSICRPCQAARQRLYEAKRRSRAVPTDRSRILHTPNRYLTESEKLTKEKYRIDNLKWKLRRVERESTRLRSDLGRYRPNEPENRAAAQCSVKKMDEEQRKIKFPICRWMVGEDESCDFRATSIVALSQHVREYHYKPQLDENDGNSIYEGRNYFCEWRGCRRRAPFRNFNNLRRHVVSHMGNANTSIELDMLREKMDNWSRQANGRRYRARTMQVILKRWRSRRVHAVAQDVSVLPLPDTRTVLKQKNLGGIRPGIDWKILSDMEKIGEKTPFLRHGFLSFDEIHVNPKRQLAPNGVGEFGRSQNAPGELAKTVLVFQYVSLFSYKKFVVNVAWYGCGEQTGLNTDTLEIWLWDVLLALQRHGFRVHALVCDGLGVNRSLLHRIVLDAKANGFRICADYVVNHPLTPDTDARLFLIPDSSHVEKRLRNCCHNRDMGFDSSIPDSSPFFIRWSHLEDVRTWQLKYPRVDRRLTQKHLRMDSYSKMNVRTAVDVMSEGVEAVMIENDAFGTSGTRYYMRIGRDYWLSVNDHRNYKSVEEAKPVIDRLKGVIDQVSIWRENTEATPERFLTDETYEDVLLSCKGMAEFFDYVFNVLAKDLPDIGFRPRIISQDPLESTFGDLRQRCGGTQNITVLGLAYNLRSINENMLNGFKLFYGIDS